MNNNIKNTKNSNEENYIKMTETPVSRLIAGLAVPTIISMLITSIYNMADTFFVSKLGTSASGAVGVIFSLMSIIQSVGFTLGMGSGSNISRLLGQKNYKKANEIASSGFFAALFFGLVLLIFGIAFSDSLIRLLGANNTIFPYAKSYGQYILLGAPFMAASFVLNNILRAQGKAKFAMIGITTGGILNMFLDPIFIFTFDMGIAGAAIATILSQIISFFILLWFYIGKKSSIELSIKHISKDLDTYFLIIKTGLPSFCRQGLASIATVMLNRSAIIYGDAAVAAMSIVSKVFMMIFSVSLGFGQGYQPVVGFNYGAKKADRVRKSFLYTLKVGEICMCSFALVGFLTAEHIIRFFIDNDPKVIEIGSNALRAQCISMIFIPLGVVCNMTFQTIGKSWTATFLSSTRQGLFFLPLIYFLPKVIGLTGIEIAQSCSDILTFVVSLPFAINFFKKINTELTPE